MEIVLFTKEGHENYLNLRNEMEGKHMIPVGIVSIPTPTKNDLSHGEKKST